MELPHALCSNAQIVLRFCAQVLTLVFICCIGWQGMEAGAVLVTVSTGSRMTRTLATHTAAPKPSGLVQHHPV